MPRGPARRYFDSDVILRFVENRPEKAIISPLIVEAERNQWTIVVSSISIVECSRRPNSFDPVKRIKLLEFFEHDFVFVRDLDTTLATSATDLMYDYNWVDPMDAAHLAAAIDLQCQMFYTYDGELIDKFSGERGLTVCNPGVAPSSSYDGLPLLEGIPGLPAT
jgi:hypothetical protein